LPVPQALLDEPARAGSPVTEDEEKLEASFGYKNWYDFCVAEWKTKWEAKVDRHEIDGDSITVYFDTAWSPPIEFYEKMEASGFEVCAYYYEGGCGFCGQYEDGYDNTINIDGDSDWVVANVPRDIDDMFAISVNMSEWESEEEAE
jgi:hypothetical protein